MWIDRSVISPRFRLASFLCLATCIASSPAEIRLPKAISDHAVLQRGRPIRIWGWAKAGARITVEFHTQSASTTADRLGEWTAWLMPEAAGGPYVLNVRSDSGDAVQTVSDVLIGDVWLASGQSNMEIPLKGFNAGTPIKNGLTEIAAATHPRLRLLRVDLTSSDYPLTDIKSSWTLCTPETAASFSAVAYFFAREIAAKEDVPIGIISAAWGGVPVESFLSLDGLAGTSSAGPTLATRALFAAQLAQGDEVIAAEKQDDSSARAAGKPAPAHAWYPDGASWLPAGPYNGMIAPLTKYSLKGFLWYQGETDTRSERAPHYAELFQALIGDWRRNFGQGDLPFLFVQISSFNAAHGWGMVRDAQRRTLSLRNTAMAVTLDVGEAANIHPADKQTVAARLALAARNLVYGEDVPFASPLFLQATTQSGAIRVWFDHGQGLTTRGGKVQGFEVAASDRQFVPAEASIEGENVVVKSSAVKNPVYVRYAWTGIAPPSLYNQAGLPASTFTSEALPSFN